MKKELIAFVVAFVMSSVCSCLFLIILAMVGVKYYLSASDLLLETFVSATLTILNLVLSFAIFYFLTKNRIISLTRLIVLSLLVGVMLGSASPYVISLFQHIGYPESDLSLIVGSLGTGLSLYFFPSLCAMLFAKLREKQENNTLMVENVRKEIA